MKRLWASVLCVCILLSFGCVKKDGVTAYELIQDPFSCRVAVTVFSSRFSGTLIKTDRDNISLVLTDPEPLNGLTFIKSGQSIGVSMHGLTVSSDEDKMPCASAAKILFDLYSESGGYDVERKDSGILVHRYGELDTITAEFDGSTLAPTRLYTKNSGVEMLFSDYRPDNRSNK